MYINMYIHTYICTYVHINPRAVCGGQDFSPKKTNPTQYVNTLYTLRPHVVC